MKTILVVDDEETIVEILEIYIEGFFENVKVVTAYGGYEAIDILKEETVDAIICDFRMPEGNGVVVYNYNEENLKLPFAWHSGTFSSDENTFDKQGDYFILEKPALDDQLTDLVQKLLEVSSISDHLYRKIKTSTLRRIKDINFPIFYKINNEKYVSLVIEGDDNINQTLEKYETKGEEYLYVKKKDLENVYKLKCSELKERIEQSGTVEDVYFVASEAIEHFCHDLEIRGVTPDQIEVASRCVNKCLKELNRNAKVKKILAGIIDSENYISTHSLITIHMANALLVDESNDDVNLENIAMAAILHDLKLTNIRLAKLRNFSSDEFKTLTHSEKKRVMSHGLELALELENTDLPKEVLNLVKNHEMFGNEIIQRTELSKTELFFHLSHELAHYITVLGFEKITEFMRENDERYKEILGQQMYEKTLTFLSL